MKFKPPTTWGEKLSALGKLFELKNMPPKRLSKKGECQDVIKLGFDANLHELPILKTWELDGGKFITMGQVYTQSLDGAMQNLGMYRLQVYDKNRLGLHWQIHKDSNHFFHEYKKANQKMPVSIAIGGDPLYTWCGTAPLPLGMFELLLYGFIKGESAKLVKCLTNPLYVPHDSDFVIEGWVDPSESKLEGPFGDHTGFYTPIEPYPVLEVSAITHKIAPVYLATVVGKPPLEDKYMGYATERIFLPLLKTNAHDLQDYHMPENGCFHNLILAKIAPKYPGHAKQIMHAFWGVGQMSFVKHAVFVDDSAPKLTDYENFTRYCLNRFSPKSLIITEGVCDALDHSSPEYAYGGKMGVDCTSDFEPKACEILSDDALFSKIKEFMPEAMALRQYFTDTKNPITVVAVKKTRWLKEAFALLVPPANHLKIVIFVDYSKNSLDNPYMLVWRVFANIDAKRDVYISGDMVGVDATNKGALEGHAREWLPETDCTPSVIASLKERGLIDVDEEFLNRFGI